MNIRINFDFLDDDSGSLALALSTLNLHRARGLSGGPEEAEFVEDVYKTVCRKVLRPWKVRGVMALAVAAPLLTGSAAATYLGGSDGWLTQAIRGLGALGLAYAMAAYLVYELRKIELDRDFQKIRADLESGISIFELDEAKGPTCLLEIS